MIHKISNFGFAICELQPANSLPDEALQELAIEKGTCIGSCYEEFEEISFIDHFTDILETLNTITESASLKHKDMVFLKHV